MYINYAYQYYKDSDKQQCKYVLHLNPKALWSLLW